MEILNRKIELDLSTRGSVESIPCVLSTEEPVERAFGREVLVHEPAAVDLSRARNGLAVLWGHNQQDLIGRMRNIRLDGRKLRGDLVFSNNERGAAARRDVDDGILTDLSIGYQVNDETARREGDIVKYYDWTPYEVSAVSVAADPHCGIGRSADLKPKGNSMPEDKSNVEVVEKPGSEKRVREIIAMGKMQSGRFMEDAVKAVENGDSIEKFRSFMLNKIGNPQPLNIPFDDGFTVKRDMPSVVKVGNQSFPILTREQSLKTLYPRPTGEEGDFSVASFVRQQAGIEKRAIASGVATVPTYVASEIIDLVRATARIIQAGSGTIILTGPANAARLSGDVTVYQHTEAATDISESAPTIEAVSLNPQALVAAIPIPFECMNDSPNLQVLLDTSIAAAFAQKIDALSIATLLADTDIPKDTVAHDPNAWANVLASIGVAMAANQDLPTAWVGNTADFIARVSQLASTAGSWLGKPPVLDGMVELPTTSISAGTAFLGGFPQGFAIAVRQSLEMELVRFQKVTSAQHVLVCTMRADGVVLQPDRLFRCLKTVA